MKLGLKFAIALILLILMGGAVYYFVRSSNQKQSIRLAITKNNEFSEWNTYRNQKYQFEIKYPKNWYETHHFPWDYVVEFQTVPEKLYISTGGPCEDCSKKQGAQVFIVVKENPKNLSPEQFLKWCYKSPDTCLHKDITIGNLKAIEVTRLIDFGAGWPTTYIFKEGKVFIIGYAQTYKANKEDYLPLYRKIVSTFRFLGNNQ